MEVPPLRSILLLLVCLTTALVRAQDLTQKIVPDRTNSAKQQEKPYVILISADGFRHDFARKYQAKNLLRLSGQGVAATAMLPSFPSLTFPNHYTIVTGLYPAHHGLVNNTFFDVKRNERYAMGNKRAVADSSWYGGTPLWVLAEQQQMLSASFYWVASESAIQGKHPSYYYIYNEKIPIDTRIQTVKEWLQLTEEKRPHLITFYFPEVDHAAHTHGPDSPETGEAVQFIDESIGKLVATVDSLHLPVNFVFVSDHGMTEVDTKNTLSLPAAIDTSQFIIPSGDVMLHLYARDKRAVKPTYEALKKEARDYEVYLTEATPAHWHYNKKADRYNRIGDILLVPRLPKVFNINGRKITPGKHGFDPTIPDMHATFYAWGPAFKEGITIETFENIHVYPLVAEILGLRYKKKSIDGKLKVLQPILK
ncbi:ectonucleotide pyrophosphatase/phosphodiesterase [Telluribacter sp.]|jgi:predicted AlkP superfamily pyrophosphatase or phosphodiesterase|uniref:alkaline phosphatase family protein n=1 Tax=Telluribacter sp. TaxID=1978767 RepID=UPI002E0DB9BA|nr:ectonucleotide pyrophosphatase/phosphodiesterase [Telluribacter sp.]